MTFCYSFRKDSKAYFAYDEDISFDSASSFCKRTHNGKLAIVNDEETFRQLVENLRSKANECSVYEGYYTIGLQRKGTQSDFKWVDGSDFLPSFRAIEYDPPSRNCSFGTLYIGLVNYRAEPKLVSKPCNRNLPFICESKNLDKVATTSTQPHTTKRRSASPKYSVLETSTTSKTLSNEPPPARKSFQLITSTQPHTTKRRSASPKYSVLETSTTSKTPSNEPPPARKTFQLITSTQPHTTKRRSASPKYSVLETTTTSKTLSNEPPPARKTLQLITSTQPHTTKRRSASPKYSVLETSTTSKTLSNEPPPARKTLQLITSTKSRQRSMTTVLPNQLRTSKTLQGVNTYGRLTSTFPCLRTKINTNKTLFCEQQQQHSDFPAALVGGVIGGIIFLLLTIIVFGLLIKRRKNLTNSTGAHENNEEVHDSSVLHYRSFSLSQPNYASAEDVLQPNASGKSVANTLQPHPQEHAVTYTEVKEKTKRNKVDNAAAVYSFATSTEETVIENDESKTAQANAVYSEGNKTRKN